MQTFDTHAHLNLENFEKDCNEIIKKSLVEKIWMVNVGTTKESSQKAIDLAEKTNEGIYASVGIHPIQLFQSINPELKRLVEKFDYSTYLELAKKEKVVAIGEVGLDYHHFEENHNIEEIKELQKKVFQDFLQLTWEIDKTLIVHCWEAYDDLLKILEKFIKEKKWKKERKGIIHSFIGSWKTAEKFLNLDFIIGLNGIITYSNSYDKLIRNCPLEKIVIETDCPFLTPKPLNRQEINQPINVKLVAEKIAEVKNLSLSKILKQTTENAKQIFKI